MAGTHKSEPARKLAFAALFACLRPRHSRRCSATGSTPGHAASPAKSRRPIAAPAAKPASGPAPDGAGGPSAESAGQSVRRPARQACAPQAPKRGAARHRRPRQQLSVRRTDVDREILSRSGPDGSRTQGEFFISKPGHVRFEYDDPSPDELIADGSSVVVRDRKLATQDVYPLSQTPLRFLLADHVDLPEDTHLIAVYADDVFVTVVVEEKSGIVGTSRLMIMFSAKDMQLKQWTVTDPQGFDTTVAVYNLDTSKRPDPALFKIDYTNYHN